MSLVNIGCGKCKEFARNMAEDRLDTPFRIFLRMDGVDPCAEAEDLAQYIEGDWMALCQYTEISVNIDDTKEDDQCYGCVIKPGVFKTELSISGNYYSQANIFNEALMYGGELEVVKQLDENGDEIVVTVPFGCEQYCLQDCGCVGCDLVQVDECGVPLGGETLITGGKTAYVRNIDAVNTLPKIQWLNVTQTECNNGDPVYLEEDVDYKPSFADQRGGMCTLPGAVNWKQGDVVSPAYEFTPMAYAKLKRQYESERDCHELLLVQSACGSVQEQRYCMAIRIKAGQFTGSRELVSPPCDPNETREQQPISFTFEMIAGSEYEMIVIDRMRFPGAVN